MKITFELDTNNINTYMATLSKLVAELSKEDFNASVAGVTSLIQTLTGGPPQAVEPVAPKVTKPTLVVVQPDVGPAEALAPVDDVSEVTTEDPTQAQERRPRGRPKKVADPLNHASAPVASAVTQHNTTTPTSESNAPFTQAYTIDTLRNLLTHLRDKHGADDLDKLLAMCHEIKASNQSRLLNTIQDIDGRVRRAVDLLGLFV